MVEPVNTGRSISVQESSIAALSASTLEKDTFNSNNSKNGILQVKNKHDTQEIKRELSEESVERTVRALENFIESNKRSLKIQVHQGTGEIMVKVISEKDGKVIREMPPEKMLDLAAKMEALAGTLFNEKA